MPWLGSRCLSPSERVGHTSHDNGIGAKEEPQTSKHFFKLMLCWLTFISHTSQKPMVGEKRSSSFRVSFKVTYEE